MFSNFKDTFIKKPQFTIKTPDAVLETISKDLPEGFSYVYDHDGFCRIECEREMTFTALNIKLPDEAKSVFSGIDYNIDDILKYAYNSQKTIEILPDDEGCYTINGNRINSQDFIVSPMSDKKLKNGKFYITPPPFPAPHPVEITGNGFSLILMIKRQPMNSINEIKYVTINEPALSITFSLDESQKSGIMNFNIMMCPSKSAQDTLAAKEIFNAFINGTGTLCGANIIPNGDHSSKMVSPEVLSFWHRVVELERKLN